MSDSPGTTQLRGIRPALRDLIALRGQARRLDLAPRGRVLATRSGGHLSRFRGRGMEFDESRPYQPGDDPRTMDWRVTARAGTAHVKLFREERERPLWLLVDQGPAMRFGTRVAFKSLVAAQAAALLGWAAVDRGDRVGGLVFDERRHLERRPAARGSGLLPLLERLAAAPTSPVTSGRMETPGMATLGVAAAHLERLVRPGSLLAIISDFSDLGNAHPTWLTHLCATSEVLLVMVYDALESAAPPPGRYPVLTPDHRRRLLDLSDAGARERYQAAFAARVARLVTLAQRERAHLVRLATHQAVGPALAVAVGARQGATARGLAP